MKKIACLCILSFLASCSSGFQVTGDLGNTNNNNETYNAAGTIVGVPVSGVEITVNGTSITVNEDGDFVFTEDLNAGDDFTIEFDAEGAIACVLNESINTVSSLIESLEVTCACGTPTQQDYTSYTAEGDGTEGTPFLIYTAQQLLSMGMSGAETDWDKEYRQVCDLDMDSLAIVPIGNASNKFTGAYDGQGFMIENIDLIPGDPNFGLFGFISGASLENLYLKNVYISSFDYGGSSTGGLVGSCEASGAIDYVKIEDVTISDNSFNGEVGGLVGTMDSCILSNSVAIDVDLSLSYNRTGGLVGYAGNNSSINFVAVKGLEFTSTFGEYNGGIVGTLSYSDLFDSYIENANMDMTQSTAGGVVGIAGEANITHVYIVGSSVESPQYNGGILGDVFGKSFVNINDSFASCAINAASGTSGEIVSTVSYAAISNSVYDFSQTCTGCDVTQTGATAVSGISTLIDGTSPALSSWDFTDDWCLRVGEAPELKGIPDSSCL